MSNDPTLTHQPTTISELLEALGPHATRNPDAPLMVYFADGRSAELTITPNDVTSICLVVTSKGLPVSPFPEPYLN